MREKRFFWLIMLVFSLITFYFLSCTNSSSSALVGKWVTEEGQDFWVKSIEFFKDGSALVNGEGTTWVAKENGYLKIPRLSGLGLSDEFLFKISGSTLTITYFGYEFRLQKLK